MQYAIVQAASRRVNGSHFLEHIPLGNRRKTVATEDDLRLHIQFQKLLIHFFFLTTFLSNFYPCNRKNEGLWLMMQCNSMGATHMVVIV
jgi:hypothetical protein